MGNAEFPADEIQQVAVQAEGLFGVPRRDRERQEDASFVAEGGFVKEREAARTRPHDFRGGEIFGLAPVDFGAEAGGAGGAPVGFPSRLQV